MLKPSTGPPLSVVNISKVFSYILEDIRADVKLPIVSSRTDSMAEAADQNTLIRSREMVEL